jgi:hypothetical protein
VSIAQQQSQMDKIRKELCNCKEGNFSNKNKKSFWVRTFEIVVRRIISWQDEGKTVRSEIRWVPKRERARLVRVWTTPPTAIDWLNLSLHGSPDFYTVCIHYCLAAPAPTLYTEAARLAAAGARAERHSTLDWPRPGGGGAPPPPSPAPLPPTL